MAGTLSTPNTFATQAGLVPASQLDGNWTQHASYINAREVGSGTLAARPTAPVGGTWYFANDDNGGTLYFAASTGWVKAAQGVSGSTTLTAPLTLSDATAGTIDHPFLNFAKTGTETWRYYFDRPTIFGNSATLMFTPLSASPSLLRLAFPAMNGGMRMYLWDTTTTLDNHPHTNTPPAFAVHGDLTVGDIATFSPRGNAWAIGIRTAADLDPATDIATFYSARNTAGVEPDAGANLTLSPMKNGGGAVSDGVVQLIAYGGGTGSQANEIQFKRRSASNTIVSTWHIGGAGDIYPFVDLTNDIGTGGNRVRAIYSSAVLIQAGTSATMAVVPGVLRLDAAAATGSQANTSENDLKTYTVPANTLVTNGDTLLVFMSFRYAANGTAKQVRLYYGGTVVLDSSSSALFTDGTVDVLIKIHRTAASSVTVSARAVFSGNNQTWLTAVGGATSTSILAVSNASANIVKATSQQGAGAAANDVVQDCLIVEYLRVK